MSELDGLIRKSQNGDTGAYGDVFRLFQDMAFGYAFSFLRDFHDAEDAVQDAFVAAFSRLGQLRDPRAFPGWFRRVVHTQADRIGRRRKPDVHFDEGQYHDSRNQDPAELAVENEQKTAVLSAIHALPQGEREAVLLQYIGGYTSTEIGEFLEISASAVRSRVQSAKRRLAEGVKDMAKDTIQSMKPSRDEKLMTRVSTLLESAGHGSLEEFRKTLTANEDVAAVSGGHPYGWGYDVQALHMAVQWDQTEKVDMLLDLGADINARDGQDCTPLQIAILYRRMSIAGRLVERGAVHDIGTAAAMGDLNTISHLISTRKHIAAGDLYWKSTALHWAGSVEAARALIESGADLESKDAHGNTPARWATGYCRERPGVGEYLYSLGNMMDILAASALGIADEVNRLLSAEPESIEATSDRYDALSTPCFFSPFTPLHAAAFHRRAEIVSLLIERGADVEAAPCGGNFRPLHTAAAFGDEKIAGLLIDAGADPTIADDTHHGTPVEWAHFWRRPEMVEFFSRI